MSKSCSVEQKNNAPAQEEKAVKTSEQGKND